MIEFKAFPKIEQMKNMNICVTQKIHGTNAQILITEEKELYCGSRSRWISPGDDNFGFAAFVHSHKDEFIEKLGVGLHFGEWAGPGINSGEGLKERTFVLFNHYNWPAERPLPPQTCVVPVLYAGIADQAAIEAVMSDLKANGSRLSPEFMRPEGCVIHLLGTTKRWKRVFEVEETKWTKGDGQKALKVSIDLSHLLQPIRLEKLISRDEKYIREYPGSLSQIVKDYIVDLETEGQIVESDTINKASIMKALPTQVYPFVKSVMNAKS